MKIEIQPLIGLPNKGLAAFVNERDRKVYIIHSDNLIDALLKNLMMIKQRTHSCMSLIEDQSVLEFKFLESVEDRQLQKMRFIDWVDEYKKLGYAMYRNYLPVRYNAKLAYSKNLKSIEVRLYNKRYEWFVVGVFSTMKDAESWMSENYPNEIVNRIVYADNVLTREHLSNIEMKKGKI